MENLILKNYLILFKVKSHTYFHSASGTFTSIDLTLSSPSPFLDFSWKVGPDPCGSDHVPILLVNDGPPSLERVQRWKLAKANWDKFQHLCSTRLHQSAISDADDPMSLFTSILKTLQYQNVSINHDFLTSAKMQSKSTTGPLRGSNVNQPEGNLNAYGITRAKACRDVRLSKKTSWRNYISKLNSQALVKTVWNRIQ